MTRPSTRKENARRSESRGRWLNRCRRRVEVANHQAPCSAAGMLTCFPFWRRGPARSARGRAPPKRPRETELRLPLGPRHSERIALLLKPLPSSALTRRHVNNCYFHQDLHYGRLHAASRQRFHAIQTENTRTFSYLRRRARTRLAAPAWYGSTVRTRSIFRLGLFDR